MVSAVYLDERTQAEVAAQLGRSQSYVSHLLAHALAFLAETARA